MDSSNYIVELTREFLFFFSALGAFNGFLIAGYFLFFAKPKHISNLFLGGFLLALSIRIGKSVFFYFIPDLALPYLQLGLTGCFFIGPFLYFYMRSMHLAAEKKYSSWKYHLIGLSLISLVFAFKFSFEHHVELWQNYVIRGIYYTWLIYTLLAAYELKPTLKRVMLDREKWRSVDVWLVSLFVGNLAIWAAYFFVGFTSYILGALLFTFMLYLLLLLLFFSKKKNSILYMSNQRYKDKKLDTGTANSLEEQLVRLMNEERLFENPNLKMGDVAKQLNVQAHTLSQLLNDNMGKSFNQYINEHRICYAKELLHTSDHLTLEAIGYECGFNSKSTFYSTFKKMTGLTPSKFQASAR